MKQDLRRLSEENRELKARLAESEEVLDAIRSGSVDAFVADDHRVFTLKDADHAYRILVETMNEGAATLTGDGVITYCNRYFSELLSSTSRNMIGIRAVDMVSPDLVPVIENMLREGRKRTVREEILARRDDGFLFPAIVSCSALPGETAGICMTVTDLTEQKKAENELREYKEHLEDLVEARTEMLAESEKRYRELVMHAPAGLYEFDLATGRFLEVNDVMCRMLGYSREDLLSMDPRELLDEEGVKLFRERIESVMSGHDIPGYTEYRVRKSDGGYLWAELKGTVNTGDGQAERLSVVAHDVTDRKMHEDIMRRGKEFSEALNRINKVLHSTFESDEIIRWVVTEGAGVLKSGSGSVCIRDEQGWTVKYGMGLPRELAEASMDDRQKRHAALAVEAGRPVAIEDVTKDDRCDREHLLRHNIRAVLTAPLITRGFFVGAIFFNYHDGPRPFDEMEVNFCRQLAATASISLENARLYEERRRAEEELRRAHIDLQRAQEVGQLGSWRLDAREDRLKWSDENYRIFGIPMGEEMTYEAFLSRVHPDDREYVDSKWKAALAGAPYDIQHRIIVDGEEKWLREKAYLEFEDSGALKGAFGITQDITGRKKAEEVLERDKSTSDRLVRERSKQLSEARIELERRKHLSEIGTLASTVAHELRNPLATIDISVYNIDRRADDPEILKKLETIRGKVEESRGIINNLLKYARFRPPEFEEIDLYDHLKGIAEIASLKMDDKANVRTDLDPVKNMTVEADKAQIEAVVNNLLNNAYDAVETGKGEIILRAYREEVFIRIEVEDNGKGMGEEQLERLFEPFYTTKEIGTGLGLSICSQIMESHGGSIDVESQPDKGTKMSIVLPVQR
ncbi:MAG: PAS domain S-box protein [Candidatus Omnitrophica bacterium]|nr:PAS domain S-box protein [Candidatus Omnitrophota bacterium]